MQRGVFLVFLIGFFARVAPASGSEINAKYREDDPRLQQKVTIASRRILIGDLLEELRRQTGVLIEENPHDRAAGTELIVSCKGTPLCALLDGIWALLSNSDSAYRWVRETKSGKFAYTLYEPDVIKQRPVKLHSEALKAYEKYATLLCDLARITPEQRARKKEAFQQTFADADPKAIEEAFQTPETWTQAALFAELVPVEQRSDVLMGRQEWDVPRDRLGEQARAVFTNAVSQHPLYRKRPDGTRTEVPPPDGIHIAAAAPHSDEILPTVRMQVGIFSHTQLIHALPLNIGLKDSARQKWLLPADSPTDGQEGTKLTEPAKSSAAEAAPEETPKLEADPGVNPTDAARVPPAAHAFFDPSFARDLKQFSRRSVVPMLALIPPGAPSVHSSNKDTTVGDFLQRIEAHPGTVMHKWRNGVLLVSYPKWFFLDDIAVPYYLVKDFPGIPAVHIDLASLVRLVGRTTEAEFGILCAHYPSFRHAALLRPVLALAQRQPQMLQAEGLAVDPETLRYLQGLKGYSTKPVIRQGTIERLRVTESPHSSTTRKDGTAIRVEGMSAGKWVTLDTMIQWPSLASEQES